MAEREMTFEVVTSDDRLKEILHSKRDEPRYALDTEFANRFTYYPRLALVQLAWPDFIIVIDPFEVDVTLLEPLFASDALALMHAASNDLDVLDRLLDVRPSRLFDTQLAAQLVGLSRTSLQFIASELLSIKLDKSEQTRDWTERPLNAKAVLYATNDVAHLFDLADELLVDLERLGRVDALREECALALATYHVERNPLESWWQVRGTERFSTAEKLRAQFICAAREEAAELLDKTRRQLISDELVLSLAKKPPRSRDQLFTLLRPRAGEEEIVERVAEGLRDAGAAEPNALRLPADEDPAVIALRPLTSVLQAVTNHRALELGLDSSFLASRGDLLALVQGRTSKLDSVWRREYLTHDLDQLLKGTVGLFVNDGVLEIH